MADERGYEVVQMYDNLNDDYTLEFWVGDRLELTVRVEDPDEPSSDGRGTRLRAGTLILTLDEFLGHLKDPWLPGREP